MMLYILRHATAEEAASSGDDGARKLTERSKEKMRGAASGLRAIGLKFDVILVGALRAFSKHDNVMIVGHEPQLSTVASILLTGSGDIAHLKLKTGGCIAIDLPTRFERGGGELRWMLTHRQLRTMRK